MAMLLLLCAGAVPALEERDPGCNAGRAIAEAQC